MTKLSAFISYASEDKQLANAFCELLLDAFPYVIKLKMMSDFPLGINYRTMIDQSLDEADILLIVATGHEKLSHTFTGYEVGYFRKSQQAKKNIDGNIKRLIIPIAIFTEIPATISDIQGIGIALDDRFFLDIGSAGSITHGKDGPIYKLLLRIDSILTKLNSIDQVLKRSETWPKHCQMRHEPSVKNL